MNDELNEPVLADDFPVHWNYVYVCDGVMRSSPIRGTVADLKREFGATEIRRCDIAKRMMKEPHV